jgi:hypothetical protein
LTIGGTNTTTIAFGPNVTTTPSSLKNKYSFKAKLSGTQTGLTNDAFTKVSLASEDFDPDSKFNTSTYRYIPTEVGYYSLTGSVGIEQGGTNLRRSGVAIYKNGSAIAFNWIRLVDGNNIISEHYVSVNVVDYSSSTSDYYELFAYQNNSAGNNNAVLSSSNARTYFTGFKLV